MPGLIVASSAASFGASAGMKRTLAGETAPQHDNRPMKKRRIVHKLHHTQPTENIRESISGELEAANGENHGFFEQQLDRAIAIECLNVGFDGATPGAVEEMRGLVDGFMRNFLSRVRNSMSSARRTTTVPHDWIYALKSSGLKGSAPLEQHFDTGDIPPSFLQPSFAPPEPPEQPPPDLEGMLGPELSGRADKDKRKYIPAHFPPFPPKYAWQATPVYAQRERDPARIREKATEEGILAEQSLRRLMAAQKAGLQKNKARKQRRSKRMKESDQLWQEAMKELIVEDEVRVEEAKKRTQFHDGLDMDEDEEWEHEPEPPKTSQVAEKKRSVSLQEGVHVNYDQKFLRKCARGV